MRRPARPELPANRPLLALIAADGVSRLGDWIYLVALPVLVWERTGSELLVGITAVSRLLPFLLLSAPAGALADRLPRVAILGVAESTRCLAMVCAAILCATSTDAVGVIAMATLAACAGTFTMPAFMSLVPQVARSDEELGRANATMSTIDGLAGIVGPSVAGVLIVLGGLPLAFLLNGVTFAVLAATVVILRTALRPVDAPAGRAGEPSIDAAPPAPEVRWSGLARQLAPQLFLDAAVSLVSAAMGVLTVLVAVDVVAEGTAFAGPLNAVSGLGAIAGALAAAGFVGPRARRGTVLAVAVLASALTALAVPAAPAIALAAMGGVMAAMVLLDTLNVTAVQVAAGGAATGRAIGLLHTLAAVSMLAGTALATILAATAGAAVAVLAVAVAAGALGGAGLVLAHLQSSDAVLRRGVLVSSLEGSS